MTWISKADHRRTKENPWGDQRQAKVRHTDMLVARTALLIALAIVRRCFWFAENPASSVLPAMKAMASVMGLQTWDIVHYEILWLLTMQ